MKALRSCGGATNESWIVGDAAIAVISSNVCCDVLCWRGGVKGAVLRDMGCWYAVIHCCNANYCVRRVCASECCVFLLRVCVVFILCACVCVCVCV